MEAGNGENFTTTHFLVEWKKKLPPRVKKCIPLVNNLMKGSKRKNVLLAFVPHPFNGQFIPLSLFRPDSKSLGIAHFSCQVLVDLQFLSCFMWIGLFISATIYPRLRSGDIWPHHSQRIPLRKWCCGLMVFPQKEVLLISFPDECSPLRDLFYQRSGVHRKKRVHIRLSEWALCSMLSSWVYGWTIRN